MAKMSDGQLIGICTAKLNDALGWVGGRLSKERQLAMQYYRGDPFGNEVTGRSQVVSRDVAESIDTVMPGLLKIFTTTDTIVVCNPRKSDDEEGAAQATDYLNWSFQNQDNSYTLMHNWIKDGLLSKLSVAKSWWETSQDEGKTEEYEGMTVNQYISLISSEDVEPISVTIAKPDSPMLNPQDVKSLMGSAQSPPGATSAKPPLSPAMSAPAAPGGEPMPPGGPLNKGGLPQQPQNMPGGQMPQAPAAPPTPPSPDIVAMLESRDERLLDCKINRINKSGKICIKIIPGEEFLTNRRATSDLEQATFTAHRRITTVSELIDEGFDEKTVMSLPGGTELDFNTEVITRFQSEDENPQREADELDPSMRRVWVCECYMRVDYDQDNFAEWRKITLAGGGGWKILDNEECDGHPFSAWSPYPSPHKLYGESMADKTMDIQLIKSTLWRQTLDGMYNNNTPSLVGLEGQFNVEDALKRRPGGILRVKQLGAISPLAAQDMSASGFNMLQYTDSVRDARIGVKRFGAGSDPNVLSAYTNTATGANLVEGSSQDQIMLLARNFAEQGVKPLFKRMLKLMCQYQDKPLNVRLRGKWVEIDPSTWKTQVDMSVDVGLGTGNKDTQVGQLMTMLSQLDAQIVQLQGGLTGPLLTSTNVYNKLKKLVEAMGYKNVDQFYTDPQGATVSPPQPPAAGAQAPGTPDPKEMAQAQIAVEQVKAQGEQQLASQKAANDAKLAEQKLHHDMLLAEQKQQHELELERARAMADIEIQREKAGLKGLGDAVQTHFNTLHSLAMRPLTPKVTNGSTTTST